MAFYDDFYKSVLPGNYALTKSMELTKLTTSGTLWYTKKFLVLYYYVFLSNDILTLEYIDKVIDAFDTYISDLDESVRAGAEAFFYPENDAVNFKSENFNVFSDFVGNMQFKKRADLDLHYQNARKYYFAILMGSGGQSGVKRLFKEAIGQVGFTYSEKNINEAIFQAALEVCVSEINSRRGIIDNSVKYILSPEAMHEMIELGKCRRLTVDVCREVAERSPEGKPGFNSIKNDMIAFIRNERQVLYYYGYFHSKSSGAADFEFSSLTPVGEMGLRANSLEFLCLWEHQKLKMISQPPTVDIGNIQGIDIDADAFGVSFTPYMDILRFLNNNRLMSLEDYKYIVSRKKHSMNEDDWKVGSDILISNLPEIKKKADGFGRAGDRKTEDGRKELLKYLTGILVDIPADRGTNPLGFLAKNGLTSISDEEKLTQILETYELLTDYKLKRYTGLLTECELRLKDKYKSSIAGAPEPIDAKTKINWDLYNIRPDKFILLGVINVLGEVMQIQENVHEFAVDRFPSLLSALGIKTLAASARAFTELANALERKDCTAYIFPEESVHVEVTAKYLAMATADIFTKIERESVAASAEFSAARRRNGNLVSLMKSYYIQRFLTKGLLRCECCGKTTFITGAGEPYVEFHHLIPFGGDGPDHYLNLFALCPDCHRKLHYLSASEKADKYADLSENNYLRLDFVERLSQLKLQRRLRSYQLELLLADNAISQEDYDAIVDIADDKRVTFDSLRHKKTVTADEPVTVDIARITNQIIHADSREYLKRFPAQCVDLVVTSPPYDDLRDYDGNVVWNFDVFMSIARELYRIIKDGGVAVWVVGDKTNDGSKSLTSFRQGLYFKKLGFNMYDVIIYQKAGSGPPHPNRYFNSFEYMFILSKGRPKAVHILEDKPNAWSGVTTYAEVTRREKDGSLTKKGKKTVQPFGARTNIWKYSNGKGFSTKDEIAYGHPAIFPEKLARDHILSWSNEGDLVLDPFGGSGTTAKAASQLGRRWILIEAVEEYCEIAKTRLGDR